MCRFSAPKSTLCLPFLKTRREPVAREFSSRGNAIQCSIPAVSVGIIIVGRIIVPFFCPENLAKSTLCLPFLKTRREPVAPPFSSRGNAIHCAIPTVFNEFQTDWSACLCPKISILQTHLPFCRLMIMSSPSATRRNSQVCSWQLLKL